MPLLDTGITFLRRGNPTIRSIKLCGQAVVLTRMKIIQQFTGYAVPDRDWLCFHMPLSWSDDYVFDGQIMRLGQAVLTNSPNGYFTRASDRDSITIGVKKQTLTSAINALQGTQSEAVRFDRIALHPSIGFLSAVAKLLENDRADGSPCLSPDSVHLLSASAEADLIDRVAIEWLNHKGAKECNVDRAKRPSEVVGRALAIIRRNSGHLPSLSQLCEAAGVGQTRLFECFQEVHGMAPSRYFRLTRLDAAYHRLSDARTPPKSVKEVAIEAGYDRPGRFAQHFRQQYGELPSETLKRSFGKKDG